MSLFLDAYLEAMEWTECNSDNQELEDADGFSDQLRASAEDDCSDFQEANADDLEAAYETGYSEAQAGHDFWLTRNGHGAGFWDRGLGKLGDRLSDAAHVYGSVYLYVGDDNLIYGS